MSQEIPNNVQGHEALMRSAAFSEMPYNVDIRWALTCVGMTEASTMRKLVVSYTFS